MNTLKSYSELEFSDDFLFSMILQNEDICKKVIKTLLNVEVEKIEYINREQHIQPDYASRGIRVDVFVKDSNRIFDLEMQSVSNGDLPLRARYYQSMIDLYSLRKLQEQQGRNFNPNKGYKYLKESYVVFICKDDPFGFGIPVYTNKQICEELPEASEKMNDKTHRVFYNASAWQKCKDSELKAFLKYIATTETDSNLTNEINGEVKSSKFNELWRNMFRTLEDMARDWGEVIGQEIAEEKAQVIAKDIAKNLAQDMAQDLAKDIAQDLAQDMAKDIAQDMAKGIAQDMAKGIAQDMAKGIAQDMAKGIAQDMAKGIAQDMAKGIAQDMAKGIAQNLAQDMAKQKLLDTARNAIAMKLSIDQISQLTGLSYDEIESLKTEQPA